MAGAQLQENEPPAGWQHGPLLPLYVVLRELVALLPDSEALRKLSAKKRNTRLIDGVWEYLRQEAKGTYRAPGVLSLMEKAVNQGQALVIFDGFDEVAPERQDVARETVTAFSEGCGDSRVIVTCRVRCYSDLKEKKHPLPGFSDVTLAPFDKPCIFGFIDRWYAALAAQGALKPQDARERAENLRSSVGQLMELACNPLLLTTMAVVHTARVELPRERVRLYQRCVEVLMRRWQHHKTGEEPLLQRLGISESKLLAVLWEVAFQAHVMGGGGGKSAAWKNTRDPRPPPWR